MTPGLRERRTRWVEDHLDERIQTRIDSMTLDEIMEYRLNGKTIWNLIYDSLETDMIADLEDEFTEKYSGGGRDDD